MRKLFVFDFDNTIADYGSFVRKAFRKYASAQPWPHPDAEMEARVVNAVQGNTEWPSLPWKNAFDHVLSIILLAEELIEQSDFQVPIIDGAAEAIVGIDRDYEARFLILSGRSEASIERIITWYKETGALPRGLAYDLCGPETARKAGLQSKPHPGILLKYCNAHGFDREDVLIVGDSCIDALLARYAQMAAFCYLYSPDSHAELEQLGAKGCFSSFRTLPQMIGDYLRQDPDVGSSPSVAHYLTVDGNARTLMAPSTSQLDVSVIFTDEALAQTDKEVRIFLRPVGVRQHNVPLSGGIAVLERGVIDRPKLHKTFQDQWQVAWSLPLDTTPLHVSVRLDLCHDLEFSVMVA